VQSALIIMVMVRKGGQIREVLLVITAQERYIVEQLVRVAKMTSIVVHWDLQQYGPGNLPVALQLVVERETPVLSHPHVVLIHH